MATIIPKTELMGRAVKYICEKMSEKADYNKKDLIEEASVRFNLSPKESESLLRILKDENKVDKS